MHLTVGLFLTKSVASRMKMLLIELLKAKCLPSLYYGLEACPINKSQIKSLNFVLDNAFNKIFLTMSYDVANESIIFLAVRFLVLNF